MTVLEVFNITMRLIDTDPNNVNATTTYKDKTPSLINLLQNDICKLAPIYKTVDITASGTSGYVAISMPTDYLLLYQLLDDNLDPTEDFKVIGNDIYVPYDFTGKMIYKYIPTTITSINDNIEFDENIGSTILANGLGAQLMITENQNLASYLNQRYEEMIRDIKTVQPSPTIKKKDKYGVSCKF